MYRNKYKVKEEQQRGQEKKKEKKNKSANEAIQIQSVEAEGNCRPCVFLSPSFT